MRRIRAWMLSSAVLAAGSGCALLGATQAERVTSDVLSRPAPPHDTEESAPVREIVTATPPSHASREAARPLTLDQALALARSTSEELRASGEDLHQAYLARLEALSTLLPQVAFRQSYFREEDDFPSASGSGSGTGGIRFGALLVEQRTSRFELRQPVFYLSGYLALAEASSVIDLAEAKLRAEQLLVDQATTTVFYVALELEKQIQTLEAAAGRDRERQREIEARASTGLARRTEVLFVQTDLARTTANLAEARERLDSARGQLALVIGTAITGELHEPEPRPSLDPDLLSARSLPELVDVAHAHRPDLAATRSQRDVAEGTLAVALGDYAPRLDLTSNYYLHRDGTLEDVDWDVTLDLSAPIFEGLRTSTVAREAQSKKRQADLFYQAQARAIAKDVTGAYHALRASTVGRAARADALKAADENFQLLETEYRLGLASNLELVAAQQALTDARLAFEIERLEEQRLAYQLAFQLGGLDRAAETTAPPPPESRYTE